MVASQIELEKLQKVENVALWIILRVGYRTPLYELHEICNLNKLATRLQKSLIKLCFQYVHGDGPSDSCALMIPPDSPCT